MLFNYSDIYRQINQIKLMYQNMIVEMTFSDIYICLFLITVVFCISYRNYGICYIINMNNLILFKHHNTFRIIVVDIPKEILSDKTDFRFWCVENIYINTEYIHR